MNLGGVVDTSMELGMLMSAFVDDRRCGLTLIDASIIPFPQRAHTVKFDSDFVNYPTASTGYMIGERVGRIGHEGFVLVFVGRPISSQKELPELGSKSGP